MKIAKAQKAVAPRPFWASSDAWLVFVEFPVLAFMATFLPERHWQSASVRYERFKRAIGKFSPDKILRGLRLLRNNVQPDDALLVATARTENHVQIFRDYLWGWRGDIEFNGAEHVTAALAKGRGVILWVAHLSFNSLAVKKAFRTANFDVSHLSRPEHGFSKTHFGIAMLNRPRVVTELRYLRDRIIIDREKPALATQRAQRALRRNEIISITAGAWEGALIATADVGETAQLDLAAGAPGLAYLTGAALLPVFTYRERDGGPITVLVDAPIPVDAEKPRDAALLQATQTFVDRLHPIVTKYPFQWRDWERIREKPGHSRD